MDVKTLCVGVLAEGDKTGCEIKHRFEAAFSHFLGASFGSIYPALAELSRQGLMSCRRLKQREQPDKKVYSLAEEGERALLDELMATPPRHKLRSEFLVLMYFAPLPPPARVAAIIDEMSAHREPLVAELERCAAGAACEPALTRFAAGYSRAVLGAALTYVRERKSELVDAVGARAAEPMALAGG